MAPLTASRNAPTGAMSILLDTNAISEILRSSPEPAVLDWFSSHPEDFANRVMPFDGGSVARYAEIVVSRRRAGRPISQFGAQIGAIALQNGFALATRNVRDFEGCGLRLINPWG